VRAAQPNPGLPPETHQFGFCPDSINATRFAALSDSVAGDGCKSCVEELTQQTPQGTLFTTFARPTDVDAIRRNFARPDTLAVTRLQNLRGLNPEKLIAEANMDWNRVEGNWKQIKGKVKEKWGKLTDDDLTVINGNREQLEGKIQERYGLAKDQVKQDIDDWYRTQSW
jgi:uncharacterized protein YjbJ (UPF0337 family)